MRITHEANIFQIVFLTFIHFQEDIYLLLVKVRYAIGQQYGVAITMLVIFSDYIFLIVLIFLSRELLRAEHLHDTGFPVVRQAELLVRLLHRLLQLPGGQFFVTLKIDTMDLGLFILIDIDIHDHLALVRGIVLLLDLNIHVLKAFAIEELLDHDLGTVHNVRRHLETFLQAQLRLQVLTLAFLDPVVIDLRDTRTLLQLDLQPNLVALDLRRQDLHIRKQAMFPKTLHCCSDLLSRYGNLIAYRQAREADQHKIIIILDTRNLYIRDLVFLRGQRVRNDRHFCRRLNLGSVYFLGKRTASETQANKKQHYSFVHITAIVYKINCSLVLPKRRSRCW